VSDHGGNNVVHVAGEEEDAGDDDAGEQFFISFDAVAIEGQGGVLTISYGGRTAHKCFKTFPIIGNQ